jgi:glycosyltransferase involved in cell wall biosynthesis
MRVLLFHGYMLRGTGSNIYNANLARALAQLGHEVHLLCQDREVEIDGVQIHNPDIHSLLPVYVKDPYPGFEVKAFPELTDGELDRYLDANVAAVRAVAGQAGGIDLALANHLVMGPTILARAGVAPFAAKIHGSALEYTVKPNPRFLPYAAEGLEASSGILVGSRHTAESLWAALPDVPGLKERTRLGPPGVDTDAFRPAASRSDPPRIVFVGKLIVSKGVDLLLAAWPLVHRSHPDARLQVAGFGEYEGGLRRLLGALEAGDLDGAREVARLGRALEGGDERPLPILSDFLADPSPGYREAARAAAGSVELIGRLEHDEVAGLLPGAEALVMPSTFPEAFGMVAAEAAAAGCPPLVARHSGLEEIARGIELAYPPALRHLASFRTGDSLDLATKLHDLLALPASSRAELGAAARRVAVEHWSGAGVARRLLEPFE